MLKSLLKIRQKNNYAPCTRIGNETEITYAYYYQCVRLQGLPPKANGESIMETHK